MATGTVKLALYNTLAESETWDVDPGGIVKPPSISPFGGVNYTNIIGSPNLGELARDGDQNLPIFFSAGVPRYFSALFTATYSPEIIAIINHNCFETGDHIEIWSGPNAGALVKRDDIVAPNRSVDLFYPLRFNDCWYNSGGISDVVWRVHFIKASGGAYIGEVFFASQYFSFEEWNPQPRPPITYDYQRNAAINEIMSGSEVIYDVIPPYVNIGLNWGRKAEGATSRFLEHQINTTLAAASHSPYKQVLVLRDDRVCVFGRLEPNSNYQVFPDDSFSPSHVFRAEYPRKFYRSGLVA